MRISFVIIAIKLMLNKDKLNNGMSLSHIYITIGDRKYAPIESWTTAEAFASEALRAKGLNSTFGWTVDLNDEGDEYGLNGNDYVLDLVSEMEIPPAFPANKSYFLVSADRSKHSNEKLNPCVLFIPKQCYHL